MPRWAFPCTECSCDQGQINSDIGSDFVGKFFELFGERLVSHYHCYDLNAKPAPQVGKLADRQTSRQVDCLKASEGPGRGQAGL
jgi:hypothetical protein